jgi:hypothetical protein
VPRDNQSIKHALALLDPTEPLQPARPAHHLMCTSQSTAELAT